MPAATMNVEQETWEELYEYGMDVSEEAGAKLYVDLDDTWMDDIGKKIGEYSRRYNNLKASGVSNEATYEGRHCDELFEELQETLESLTDVHNEIKTKGGLF
jgi:hypothetical protein